jgi:hypothetical protein
MKEASAYEVRERTGGTSSAFSPPHTGTWYFVWDNSFSFFTPKSVTAGATAAYPGIETRQVTESKPLVEGVAPVGIALALVGVVISAYGFVAKPKPSSQPTPT